MSRVLQQEQPGSAQPPSDRFTPSILIVDDHPAVRAGLRNLISSRPGWFICGEATNGEQAVSLALELKPSVVVMDISMPGMDGLEATRRIRERLTSIEILVVSQHDSEQVVFEAQRAGARGFVVKSHLSADLLPALEAALLHSSKISSPVSKAWHSAISTAKQPAKVSFPDPGPHDDLDLMSGGGEMGAMMRAHNWAKTPFGPVSQWPQSLRTALRICLDSRFPILIWWGPELRLLYNDAYRPALGSTKHPKALGAPGKESWSEIWDTIGPMLEGVMRTGHATWENDQLLLFDRHGYVEESYWTYSYSAIRLTTGDIGGIFSAVHEVTDRVLSARRLRTLREVADQVVQAKNDIDACHLAMQSIMRNPADCPYAMIFLCDGRKATRVAASFDAAASIPSILDLTETDVWGIQQTLRNRAATLVEVANPEWLPGAPYGAKCRQAISLPILGSTREAIAVLTLAISPYRELDESYREFFESLAKNLAANINNARAYDEERRRAEALAELDRAKTVFFSNVSHEFRTPLTLMLGPLEDSLAASQNLPAEHREHIEIAHRNSVRLLRLVNTLLDFSRIEAGRMQASYEPTDLAKFTAELASVFRSATERAGLKLSIKCEPISEPVYVDREMWEKIVLNLLSNAFKFTFEGEIEVALRQVEGAVELSVCDTGTGIPADELPHLFERFYRVKGAQGRTFEGSGIGLSLVQELARLHGGNVRVQSEIRRGSTFIVTIPMGQAHLAAERIRAQRTLQSTGLRSEAYLQEALRWLPGNAEAAENPVAELLSPAEHLPQATEIERPARILLADDNPDMREYVQRLLSDVYDVVSAGDGEAALLEARKHRPDLIVSDVMMPRMDGFALLQALRADESLKTVPLILLSARAGEEARMEGLQSGADDYLIKPFSARELLTRINSHLNMARLRRQSEESYRELAESLDSEVRARTKELEQRTADLVRQSEQLRELSWRLLHTQEEERRHIARELHDSAGQTLTVLGMNLAQLAQKAGRMAPELAAEAEKIQQTVQQLHREIRTTSYLLHPPLLDENGLSSALRWYVSGLVERSGLDIQLNISDDFGRLPSDMELLVFRLVQECLTNIHRHSGSNAASIRITREVEQIRVEIQDQGRGMTTERLAEIQSRGAGVGIRGMRERLRQFKGQMQIESGDSGTCVLVTIPIAQSDSGNASDEIEPLATAI
jgi:signal transduction histidine kinase